MSKKKGWRLRRYYKYYWFYYLKERLRQVLGLIMNLILTTLATPVSFLQELWECKTSISKIPTRKQCKEKLIELGLYEK